jgi:N-acetyl-anhydromuramyl-L-alanine amidase AmpD
METIKKGDFGSKVENIQKALKQKGFNVQVDKDFGGETFDAVVAFQRANNLLDDGIVGEQTYNALMFGIVQVFNLNTLKCVDEVYHINDYYKSASIKTQICLHHTAGPSGAKNTVDWWNSDKSSAIGTAFVIGGKDGKKDGNIIEAFPSENWAWHLGVEPKTSLGFGNRDAKGTILDSKCIGIEICNWGFLGPSKEGFINYVGQPVKDSEVCELKEKIRGKKYFQKYTDAQIESTKKLLLELGEKHSIDLKRNYDLSWFNLSKEALSGQNGVWNHCNFRSDKIDIFPQPEMLDMLNSL